MNQISRALFSSILKRTYFGNSKGLFYIQKLVQNDAKYIGHKTVQLEKIKFHNTGKFFIFKLVCRFPFLYQKIMSTIPPPCVKGMTELDRSLFKKVALVPGLKVPVKYVDDLKKIFKKSCLKLLKVKNIALLSLDDPDFKTHRLLLLDTDKYTSQDDFSEIENAAFVKYSIRKEFKLYEVELSYENWSLEDVMKAVLPPGETIVSGFDIVGHIAHVNLKDHLMGYKTLIGQVILDKFPNLKTVVNKTNTIDNTYRNFQMEILAGEDRMEATLKENGCTFTLDFSKVYWNSRLGTEHQRIVDKVNKGDIVFDVFAGIGPFVVPIAKKEIFIFANDLNPESYKWLKHNVSKNHVHDFVKCYNLDGRDFIKQIFTHEIKNQLKSSQEKLTVHIVMNLPAIAIEFLDAFRGLRIDDAERITIAIHCYCFSNAEDQEAEIRERVMSFLGDEMPASGTIRTVRKVAPNKDMFCVEFNLPRHALVEEINSEEPDQKRFKSESSQNTTA